MQFSVIIPCFNSQSTIKKTLQSCLDQTFRDFEVVVVNNGSTDKTSLILDEFKDVFLQQGLSFQVIHNKVNGGPSFGRNKGWELAKGNYIAFLDHDDFWHSQKLEIVDKVLKKHPDIDCLGHAFTIDLDQHDDRDKQLSRDSFEINRVKATHLLLRNFAVTPAVVIKRDIAERFDEGMRFCEDHDLWLRLAGKYRVYYLDLALVWIGRPVLSKGGQSANRWKMRKGEFYLLSKFCRSNMVYFWLWPFLILFALLKHIRSLFW